MTENDIARVIFANLFPRGMCPADWDSGAILGPDNCVREQFLMAARALLSASIADTAGAKPFQARVQPWLMECFGAMIAGDREERNHRFIEEALELVQACGMGASEAHQLVDYVYGRPVGEPHQEVGGVMVTLAALCLANDLDMHEAAETELARIWTKVEQIRAKQAAKPKHSPLPQAIAAPPAPSVADAAGASETRPIQEMTSVVRNPDYATPTDVNRDEAYRMIADAPVPGIDSEAASASNWAFEAAKINFDRIHAVVMEFGCRPQDTVVDWLRERLTAAQIDRFECAARKQGTAGGNDAADCDWPGCGCDPKANRVFESLEESGLFQEAERYRWARSPENGNAMYIWISEGNAGGNLDKLIDAAIAKEKQT
ncbi:hypothetical protein [Caballeronia sp. EK]|uniref:hypothetical protein n=1 Tax=Caballeronia sp. EK TaxID=2767469 RepID=UPI0021041DB7|nr:hypothetical protein [Caballeronia sp. EK]